MNATWHTKHRMPRGASIEQRIAWHLAHARHCACRPIPAKLKARIRMATAKLRFGPGPH
jgi:hypothetical protein